MIVTKCSHPTCFNTKPCALHASTCTDAARPNSTKRLYTYRWQQARKLYMDLHPLCLPCHKVGLLTPTFAVDHIVPHRGNAELFWNEENWQPICEACHNAKTRGGS